MKEDPPDPTLTSARQIDLWVEGDARCPNTSGECCPDFSCCMAHLMAPPEERRAFKAASWIERESMLLRSLVNVTGHEVSFTFGRAPALCDECRQLRELRPYGAPSKPNVCFPCFTGKDTKRGLDQ